MKLKPVVGGKTHSASIRLSCLFLIQCLGLLPQCLGVQILNSPPELQPLTNWVVAERRIVTFTNVANDVDVPAQNLQFGMGPGIPDGATINPVTGVFYWRPSEIQGGTTNLFDIIVTDNGVPSMSATQQFQIIVRDTHPDFALSLGSTNLLLNETGSVAVMFSTLVPVTNISFTLRIDDERLTQIAFTSRISDDAAVEFSNLGSDRFHVVIAMVPGNLLQGTLELGALSFAVVDQPNSAIVPLDIIQLSGIHSDGRQIGQTAVDPGRVFVVLAEPLLEIVPPYLTRLRVYLLPLHTGSLLYIDNPVATLAVWYKLADFPASRSKTVRVIDDPNFPGPKVRLYRLIDPHRP